MNARSTYDAFLARAVDAHMAGDDRADELAYELAMADAKNQQEAAVDAAEAVSEAVSELAIRLYAAKPAQRGGIASDFATAVLMHFEVALSRIAQDRADDFLEEAIEELNERSAP